MRRNPAYAIGTMLLVGLGVGANTAVFTVARAVLLRPLPFENPDRLVALWRESLPSRSSFGGSWPHLSEYRQQKQLFERVEAYIHSGTIGWTSGTAADLGTASELQVTGGFFRLLGVHPIQGRLFLPDELLPKTTVGTVDPVIVSYDFWRQRLRGRSDVLGQMVRLGQAMHTVVGVLPRDFRVYRSDVPEVFIPLRPLPGHLDERRMTYLEIVARLRPGVNLQRARLELAAYSRRVEAEHSSTDAGFLWHADEFGERLFGSVRPLMRLLLATAGFVLLISCANLGILLAVRVVRRHRELAIRAALGARTLRIFRQLVGECLDLAVLGGAAGLLLAMWVNDLFAAYCSRAGIGLPPLRIDGAVLGYAFLISLASGALFAAAPLWHFRRLDMNTALKVMGPADLGRSRLSGGLMVVAEIALSTVLLIGAGRLLDSFVQASRIDPGFHPENVAAVLVGQVSRTARFNEAEAAFWAQLVERARSLPGVRSAAFSGSLPLASTRSPENMKGRIELAGRHTDARGVVEAEYQDVSPAYFQTMGIPLRRGRTFEDSAGDAWAAIVNESFAREFWGGKDPLGAEIKVGAGRTYTIVGVAGDVRQYGVHRASPKLQIYRVLRRGDVSTLSKWPSQYLIVRTWTEPENIAQPIKDLVRSIDPERTVIAAHTMQEVAFRSTAWDRLKTIVVGLFGAIALILTLAGMYGVISHSVSQRRLEIAIRIVMGGQPSDIRHMVLCRGLALGAAGLAMGIAAAFAVSPLFSDQLHGEGTSDMTTLTVVSLLILCVSTVACYLPIRSATRLDPATVLRGE